MTESKTYRVATVWGEEASFVTQNTFKTEGEVKAYWQGVEDSQGWMEYHSVEDALDDEEIVSCLARQEGKSVKDMRKTLQGILKWIKEGAQE
jgi:hypothetical protein